MAGRAEREVEPHDARVLEALQDPLLLEHALDLLLVHQSREAHELERVPSRLDLGRAGAVFA